MNKISNYSKTILSGVFAIIFIIIFISLKLGKPLSGWALIFPYGAAIFAIQLIILWIVSITIYYDIAIKDKELILTSATGKKVFAIAEIEITHIVAAVYQEIFSVTIVTDRVYRFSFICYTKKNFEVLKELIQVCKKTSVTTEEFEKQVRHSFWSLK